MKIGTHNLGHNALSSATVAKLEAGALTIRQFSRGVEQTVHLSAEQIALLKDVLA